MQQIALCAKHETILSTRIQARRLAKSMLSRWGSRIEEGELYSIVDLALCQAAENYSPDFGTAFPTFLFYHLKGCLVRAVSQRIKERRLVSGEDMYALLEDGQSMWSEESFSEKQPDKQLETKEQLSLTLEAVKKLRNQEKTALLLIMVEDQPVQDVAKQLGVSRSHASRLRNAALSKVRKRLHMDSVIRKSAA